MKIKEILAIASKHVGATDVERYLKTGECDDKPTVDGVVSDLSLCYDVVMEELSHREPLIDVFVKENTREVMFEDFPRRALEVLEVTDSKGGLIDYEIKTDRLVFKKPYSVRVVYAYVSKCASIEDECCYGILNKVTPNVIAYGVASEFCALRGNYSQSEILSQKYIKNLNECFKPRGKAILAGRMWR